MADLCPSCRRPRVRRHGRLLKTCGVLACGHEAIAASKRGKSPDDATRAKIGATVSIVQKGRPVSQATRERIAKAQREEHGHHWAGDRVGYSGVHKRARAALPQECAMADGSCAGRLEVAFCYATPLEFERWDILLRRPYSPRVEDYMRLCRSHHIRYDRGATGALAGA